MWVWVSTVNCLIMVGALTWRIMTDTSSFQKDAVKKILKEWIYIH